MTVALRAESRKLLTTQVWFWMFVLQLGLTLLVACLVSAFSKTTDTGVPLESVLNGHGRLLGADRLGARRHRDHR